MGLARIEFSSVEIKSGGRKALKDGSKVLAEATKFEFKTSAAGNAMIKVQYKVTDEEAVDVDGGTDFGPLYDNIVFAATSAKMAKLKLKGLSYDGLDDLVIEDVQDVKDLAADLRDNYVGQEVVIEVVNEEYEEKVSSKVKWVNSVG